MIVQDFSGKLFDLHAPNRSLLLVEVTKSAGLVGNSGIYVEQHDDYPSVEAYVLEIPEDRSIIDRYAPDLKVDDRVVFRRYATGTDRELAFESYDWEDVETFDRETMKLVTQKQYVKREIHLLNIEDVEAIAEYA